jgi:hypothetical protein
VVLLRDLSPSLCSRRSDVAPCRDRDGPRTARRVRASCLLFFALYLPFSIVVVSYDYHDPSHSKTCPLCLMRSSLSSSVTQASFVPQIDDHPFSLVPPERREPFLSAVFTPGVPYRGPPPLEHS